jgi:SAM-dependent methyltransferase
MNDFACRSCGATAAEPVLNLGRTPLANSLPTAARPDQAEATYPLELVFCPGCGLLQITETVPPEVLFRDYLYFSSFSDTMLTHARDLAGELVAARGLGPSSLVVEAASNDGYLLQNYVRAGVPVLGVEPATNVAETARGRGVETLNDFFGRETAERLRAEGRRADVFHAHNVLAHVADLNGFVSGVRTVLKDDGLAVIEAPYARDMVDHCEFDTIYHEHLCYFTLSALDRLFRRHGLAIVDVRRTPIHGGTLRLYAAPDGSPAARAPAGSVGRLLAEERALGLDRADYYRDFARRVEALKASLVGTLARLKSEGKRLAAYGASAKGSTLLNAFGIGRETLDYVADRSTVKQGRFTPGARLPIVAPGRLLDDPPDFVLLLTWNFADEILAQQAEYVRRGGRFIIPVPTVRVAP